MRGTTWTLQLPRRRRTPVLAVLVALAFAFGAGAAPAAAGTDEDFVFDTWRRSAFATQRGPTWCVAAAVQMMRNLALGESAGSATAQRRYLRYAQRNDGIPGVGLRRGSDADGWAAALRRFAPGGGWEILTRRAAGPLVDAVAARMRAADRPAGVVVAGGLHAWVITGFTSVTDPRDGWTRVTGIWVAGPLWPRRPSRIGLDPRPHTWIPRDRLDRWISPVRDAAYQAPWEGALVAIVPVATPAPTPAPEPSATPAAG